ncbi:Na+/H+ exchanger 1 [Actinidia rufa]|uniref:Na+/H+ exchanger 1 n=1 Tax=Actinidia rufa TaxID=165716 RepID=A0A7J0EWF7_9ERIC|nr:Na+/H+ exchanger 1 [Actinidia rufa]
MSTATDAMTMAHTDPIGLSGGAVRWARVLRWVKVRAGASPLVWWS